MLWSTQINRESTTDRTLIVPAGTNKEGNNTLGDAMSTQVVKREQPLLNLRENGSPLK